MCFCFTCPIEIVTFPKKDCQTQNWLLIFFWKNTFRKQNHGNRRRFRRKKLQQQQQQRQTLEIVDRNLPRFRNFSFFLHFHFFINFPHFSSFFFMFSLFLSFSVILFHVLSIFFYFISFSFYFFFFFCFFFFLFSIGQNVIFGLNCFTISYNISAKKTIFRFICTCRLQGSTKGSRCSMVMWCLNDIGRDSWNGVGPRAWIRACFNSLM